MRQRSSPARRTDRRLRRIQAHLRLDATPSSVIHKRGRCGRALFHLLQLIQRATEIRFRSIRDKIAIRVNGSTCVRFGLEKDRANALRVRRGDQPMSTIASINSCNARPVELIS
jgi:hypothetical protein